MSGRPFGAIIHRVAGGLEAAIAFAEARGWTDGLPIVPPTPARVRLTLAADLRPADTVIARLAPTMAEATLEGLAINLVMAGGAPALLSALVAALEAVADPAFNLLAVQATTNPAAPLLVINGPARAALGFQAGANALGQGWRANATLGRALRFALLNIGGARPGEADRATHGQPGKFTFCLAEREEENPWEPLHVERGRRREESAVTVLAPSGTTNVIDRGSGTADDLLKTLAGSLRIPGSNTYLFGGGPALILSPEHARVLAADGLSKDDVKRALFERTPIPLGEFPRPTWDAIAERAVLRPLRPLGMATAVPLADRPEDIIVIVAGGAGRHSVALPTFGDSAPVTRAFPTATNVAMLPPAEPDPDPLEFLDPTPAGVAAPPAALAAPRTLAGAVVGLLDNAKPNAHLLLAAVGELLQGSHGAREVVPARKATSTSPAPAAILDELAARCDLVVTAAAD
jgi:hypothetical protein